MDAGVKEKEEKGQAAEGKYKKEAQYYSILRMALMSTLDGRSYLMISGNSFAVMIRFNNAFSGTRRIEEKKKEFTNRLAKMLHRKPV